MKVGVLGLGRLGLPLAALLSQVHRVYGVDPAPSTANRLLYGHDWEKGLAPYLGRIRLVDELPDVDLTIICVPTPHQPELDGTWPTDERAPFDLSYVEEALRHVRGVPVLTSTVLPGDCASLGIPSLIYNPAFPAMGTTVADFVDPEFIIAGGTGTEVIETLWRPIVGPVRFHHLSWETAELVKLTYNTMVGMKLAVANTVGWLADKVGADGGEVMEVLKGATRRIVSDAYLSPGLGDGGACHPRDQLAMSWLARTHGVYDLFGDLLYQREAHSSWVASIAADAGIVLGLPVVILGAAYKPESTLTDGSPARLMANQTGWEIVEQVPDTPHVVVIGVPHSRYQHWDFTDHVVIDPWGIIAGAVQPGRRPRG